MLYKVPHTHTHTQSHVNIPTCIYKCLCLLVCVCVCVCVCMIFCGQISARHLDVETQNKLFNDYLKINLGTSR